MKSSKPVNCYRIVSLNLASFKRLGLWFYIPHPVSSIRYWFHVFWRVFAGILIFSIPPLAQIVYFVRLVSSTDFEIQEAASSINLILTELLVSLRLLDLFTRRDGLTQLTGLLVSGEFYRGGVHRNILERSIELSRRLFYSFLIGASLDVLFHMVVAPGINKFRSLPVKMDLVFIDVNDPALFTYICAYQIMYKPVVVICYIALQTLTWAFLLFAIAQLDILIYDFKNMKDLITEAKIKRSCNENDAFEEIFTRCIRHHRAIIRFLNIAEETFRGQFSLGLLLIACIVCTTGVQFISIESPSKNIVAVLWVLAYMQIFIAFLSCDCYFGNAVCVKSTEVATVAFECPWLTVSPGLKKNLVVFIARAQKPLVITAFNLVPITLPTFTTVMNWTYKAFAVMNEMKK